MAEYTPSTEARRTTPFAIREFCLATSLVSLAILGWVSKITLTPIYGSTAVDTVHPHLSLLSFLYIRVFLSVIPIPQFLRENVIYYGKIYGLVLPAIVPFLRVVILDPSLSGLTLRLYGGKYSNPLALSVITELLTVTPTVAAVAYHYYYNNPQTYQAPFPTRLFRSAILFAGFKYAIYDIFVPFLLNLELESVHPWQLQTITSVVLILSILGPDYVNESSSTAPQASSKKTDKKVPVKKSTNVSRPKAFIVILTVLFPYFASLYAYKPSLLGIGYKSKSDKSQPLYKIRASSPNGKTIMNYSILDQAFYVGTVASTSLSKLVSSSWTGNNIYSGYLSVIDVHPGAVRFLRSDNSLIAGEFLPSSGRRESREPVFPIMAILERVRLAYPSSSERGAAPVTNRALVIGLGSGSVASAMTRHGHILDICEIDRNVVHMAKTWFELPKSLGDGHIFVLGGEQFVLSAVANNRRLDSGGGSTTTTRSQHSRKLVYDFIVHDVFTRGTMDPSVLTVEFWENVKKLLTPGRGVIAIDLAGDIKSKELQSALLTILHTFKHCRAFGELSDDDKDNARQHYERMSKAAIHDKRMRVFPNGFDSNKLLDLSNTALFCSPFGPIEFRDAIEADFLNSISRKVAFQHPIELDINSIVNVDEKIDQSNLITIGNAGKFATRSSLANMLPYWYLMRLTVDDKVWQSF